MKSFVEFVEEELFFQMLEECPTLVEILLDEETNEELLEKAMSSNKTGVQPWAKDDIIKSTPDKNFDVLPEKVEHIMKTYIDPIKKKFESSLKRAAVKDSKILTSVKSFKSIKSKIERGKSLSKMGDILRAAILVPSQDDIPKVLDNMRKVFSIQEYEHKEKGKNDWGYYGSHHFAVDLDGVLCEVQVMPKTTWTYKEKGHEIYTKYRNLINDNPEFKNTDEYKKAMAYSKRIFMRGAGNKGVRL